MMAQLLCVTLGCIVRTLTLPLAAQVLVTWNVTWKRPSMSELAVVDACPRKCRSLANSARACTVLGRSMVTSSRASRVVELCAAMLPGGTAPHEQDSIQ